MSHAPPRLFTLRDGTALTVRTAAEGDAAAVLALVRHMAATSEHVVTQADELDRDEAAERERLWEMAAAPHHLALVAVAGGEVVGDLSFRGHPRRRMAHHGQVGLGVAAPWRGRGVGRAMMATVLDWAAAHPTIEKVTLGVFANNHEARRLYERLGFAQEARQRMFFKTGEGRYVDDVLMALWVKPGLAPAGFNTYTPGSLP